MRYGCGGRRLLSLFAPTDQRRSYHNQNHSAPPERRHFFMANELRGGGREHKPNGGQRPNEADIRFGQQHQQGGKENSFEEDAQQDIAIGGAFDQNSFDGGNVKPLKVSDLFEASAQQHHSDCFEQQGHEQNENQFQ